ncbi:MAG: 50S ribosomal protein L11 methyltransferase [Desulfobacter sp.]|nr:MAG: 50S ribosomal protein L11 methyltransferase [Desulfobacter sp.]
MAPFNKTRVLDILFESEARLTARAYIREIASECGLSPREAKKILTTLVNDQTLAYQDLYGSTYVMESFSKPVRITDRFIISPPGTGRTPHGPDDIDITILVGISFGSGHHPTTRLCLEALDRLFYISPGRDALPGKNGGDIGTGSGILAIAACKAGMATCRAWEIDANAVSEARQNVAANNLTARIPVIDSLMSPDGLSLGLITANLRFPTLKQIAPLIRAALLPGAAIVLSGIRTWETQDLKTHYQTFGFTPLWEKNKKNWSVVIFKYSG